MPVHPSDRSATPLSLVLFVVLLRVHYVPSSIKMLNL